MYIRILAELRSMEESYDRSMSMFQKQQSESKDKALAYKIEIEAAQETYRVAKTENEKLKEVNEIQHMLWKIFVNENCKFAHQPILLCKLDCNCGIINVCFERKMDKLLLLKKTADLETC